MNKLIYILFAVFTLSLIACEQEQVPVTVEGIVFERVAADCNTDTEEGEQEIMLRTYKADAEYTLVGDKLEEHLEGIQLGKAIIVEGLLSRNNLEVLSISKPISFQDIVVTE